MAKGSIVLCDRFADSTTAYQGYGGAWTMEAVAAANKIGTQAWCRT
jgi:thymidylate kinase